MLQADPHVRPSVRLVEAAQAGGRCASDGGWELFTPQESIGATVQTPGAEGTGLCACSSHRQGPDPAPLTLAAHPTRAAFWGSVSACRAV